jgi:hypothetical protein
MDYRGKTRMIKTMAQASESHSQDLAERANAGCHMS